MPTKFDFDLLIIGSGPAGFAAMETAAGELGAKRVALVESYERLGGECPNWGCIPTKSLLQTVDVVQHCSRGGSMGVPNCGGETDFASARKRQEEIIDKLTGNSRLEKIVKEYGVSLIRGVARFVGMNEVEVGKKRYTAKRIINAAGTDTFVPPIDGLDQIDYLTARKVFALDELPASVLIIGGGPIGVEFSKVFAVFGVKPTIIEVANHILPHEDHEIAAVVNESLRRMGVEIVTEAKVAKIRKAEPGVCATVESTAGGKGRRLSAEAVLVATGKRSTWKEMGAEQAGIMLDKRGFPELSKYLRTSNPSVYAAGDATGGPMFTSVAHRQGPIAAKNALKGDKLNLDLRVMPRGTYGDPEAGSVGITEEEARRQKLKVLIGRAPFGVLSKALVTDEPMGLAKIICDKKSGEVLGGHVVGHSAAELVHILAVAMYGRMTYHDLADMLYAFPTYAEAISVAAQSME
jgi:mercuric reductase